MKLAPGGIEVSTRVACGRMHTIEIGVGSKWSDFRNEETADLYLPYGDHPSDYAWPVAGATVYVYHDGDLEGEHARRLLICLLASMATEVNWYRNGKLHGTYFINDMEKLINAAPGGVSQRLPGKVGAETSQNQLSQEAVAAKDAA